MSSSLRWASTLFSSSLRSWLTTSARTSRPADRYLRTRVCVRQDGQNIEPQERECREDARQRDVLLLALLPVPLLAVPPPVRPAADAYAAQEAGVGRTQLLRRSVVSCRQRVGRVSDNARRSRLTQRLV